MPLVLPDQLVVREAQDQQVLKVTSVSLVLQDRQVRRVLLALPPQFQDLQVLLVRQVLRALQVLKEIKV